MSSDTADLAVDAVSGWWRDKSDQDHWSREARYSLVVSIHTAATTVDLYSPVHAMIEVPVPPAIVTEIQLEDIFDDLF